jgi:hypothetical protein
VQSPVAGGGKVTSRTFEMFEMLFEDDGVPKVFEDSD